MARLRQNFQRGTITDNPLTAGAVTFNSAALASLGTVAAPNIGAVTLDPLGRNGAPEIVWVTAHTFGTTSATILRAQESTAARAHPAGTVWENAATALDFRKVTAVRTHRESTSLTLNSVTWANVDTALDLVVPGVVLAGDFVQVGLSAAFSSEAVVVGLDAVSLVGGAPVRTWSRDAAPDNADAGVSAWLGVASAISNAGGSVIKQIVAGDLSAGVLTIRLRYRTTTAANKTLLATPGNPLTFWATNLLQP